MEMQIFEPMSTGRILDQTFRIYKSNFLRFLAIVAIIQVPIGLVGMLSNFAGVMFPEGLEMFCSISLILFLVFLGVVGRNLCNGALMRAVSEAFLGREATVSEAYRFAVPRLGSLIWASILVGVIVAAGFVLLIVPGVIFSLIYALTVPAIVLEGLSAGRGMTRSRALVKGNMGKVLAVLAAVFVLGLIVGYVLRFAASMIVVLGTQGGGPAGAVVTGIASIISDVLVMPIGATASILLYYDIRIRKEGFDLEMLSQRLGLEATTGNEPPPIPQ